MTTEFLSLESLLRFYADRGIEKVYVKKLAANDNSKNQVYFGPGFNVLNLFPIKDIVPDSDKNDPIFKAALPLLWIGDDKTLVSAPAAQIILYPQYPEIRFSGFLKGAAKPQMEKTRTLMTSRVVGRVLFMGVDEKAGQVIGSVFDPQSSVSQQFAKMGAVLTKATDIFYELITSKVTTLQLDSRLKLLQELCRIHRLGWIDSKRLDKSGAQIACTTSQCGGYTLEAEFGITPNARSEPDYLGWELKQYAGNVLTLMTPNPSGGFYKDHGAEQFVRTYGYAAKSGQSDRINFGGTHYCEKKHLSTGLTLKLSGYDNTKKAIVDAAGGIELVTASGVVAASWAFAGILSHWARKHQKAAYIPSQHRIDPSNQYQYKKNVLLCVGTDPLLVIEAISQQKIYYDPGIKLEKASTQKSTLKTRSQFRVAFKNLGGLYHTVQPEDVSTYC